MSNRTARQCRQRYKNYLADDRQPVGWTAEEEHMVIAKYEEIGPKWVQIAKFLPGRSGNDVKNRWHKHILKFYDPPDRKLAPEKEPAPPVPLVLESPRPVFEAIPQPPQPASRPPPNLQYVLNDSITI
jgi:hypothetical protein